MRTALLACLLAIACTADGGNASADSGSGGTTGSTTVAAGSGTTQAGSPSTSGGSSVPDDTTAGDASTGSDGATTASTPEVPGDCRTLLLEDPSTPDGVYSLHRGGNPQAPTFDAYCDMTTEGGGWTLVGRSVEGGGGIEFGWYSAAGAVDDDALPYSLDAATAELEFNEVLVGSYSAGKTWGSDAYILTVPDHFLFVYRQAPHPTTATTVIGSCSPPDGPEYLRYIGWTEEVDLFHITSVRYLKGDGLEPGYWDSDVVGCDQGANLHDTQAMIMVR